MQLGTPKDLTTRALTHLQLVEIQLFSFQEIPNQLRGHMEKWVFTASHLPLLSTTFLKPNLLNTYHWDFLSPALKYVSPEVSLDICWHHSQSNEHYEPFFECTHLNKENIQWGYVMKMLPLSSRQPFYCSQMMPWHFHFKIHILSTLDLLALCCTHGRAL